MKQNDLRLFCVTNRVTGEIVCDDDGPAFFREKSFAKRLRDALPGKADAYQVSKGPDHRLFVKK